MDQVVQSFMTDHSLPGFSVAVARNGTLLHSKAYGFADRERAERATPASLFRIASVSKPITSVALFTLIEKGRLRLDHTVFGAGGILGNDFGTPRYPSRSPQQILLWHLMTHTAGGWQNDGTDPMFSNPTMNQRQLISWTLANRPLANVPGEHYAYSNFGYCVLGRVIEKVTGQPYADYVRDAVLKPCGITDMQIGGGTLADHVPHEVVYYGEGAYTLNPARMDSHGGWLATAPDLIRFVTHVDGFAPGRNILAPRTIRDMTTPTLANPGYAKGWSVNKAPHWWHTGSMKGTTSILVRTATGFAWAAVANSRETSRDTSAALDDMMWTMVRKVANWRP